MYVSINIPHDKKTEVLNAMLGRKQERDEKAKIMFQGHSYPNPGSSSP